MVMILRRTVKALLTNRMGLVRPKAAFLNYGMGLVRSTAMDSTTRRFLSTSDDSNLKRADEIKALNDKIADYEHKLLTAADSSERTAIINQVTAIRNQVTALLTTQQGNLPHILPSVFSDTSR
jgi:hypothetical protein